MILDIINVIFYLVSQQGFAVFKAYGSMTEKQRQSSKFCTVLPLKVKNTSRAAKSNGDTVTEYEVEVLTSLYFNKNTSIEEIYETSDTVVKVIESFDQVNAKDITLKDIRFDAAEQKLVRDMIITVSFLQEE